MFPKHNKITTGFVIQTYYTLSNGHLICIGQEFVAGDPVDYEDMDGQPVEVDVTKEVYCPMDMKQPKQLPDEDKAVKFLCSDCSHTRLEAVMDCSHTRLEAVMDGPHTTVIEGMFKSGSIEYGDTESAGFVERFQCVECGHVITKDDEDPTSNDQQPITNDDELVEWCKENCNQE